MRDEDKYDPIKMGDRELKRIEVQRYCDSDPLLQAIKEDYASVEVLRETLIRLAEISAIISYERKEALFRGESVSLIARREITALTALRDATLKMIDQRLKQQEIDLESSIFRNLLVYLVRTFQESMTKSGIPINDQKIVISNLSKSVDQDEWKLTAKKMMGVS